MVRDKPLACVMGDLDLVRPLGLAGIRCAVVAGPDDLARHSRFTCAVVDRADPLKRPEELVERLVQFGSSQPEPPVLFYQDDSDLLFITRHRDRLAQAFRFVLPDPGLVEDLLDKGRFLALAEKLDLPVPGTRRLSPEHGPAPEDIDLPFPLVVKPPFRALTGTHWSSFAGGRKVLQVETPEDLRAVWQSLAAMGVEAVVQQLIPGPETQIESYHVYRDEQGEVVGEFTGQKIRTYPAEHGYSTALVITDRADVAALGRDVTQRLDLRGVAKLDFKRGRDGRLYLLEVNPRFNLWHHPGAIAGVNLPALVYGDLTGLPRPTVPPARSGVRWCYVGKDGPAAKAQGVPLVKWLPWALSCEAKTAGSWDDPRVLLHGVLLRLRRPAR